MKITITIYCDGGARGNPGPAGIGFIAFVGTKEIKRFEKFIGRSTNNNAEYQAVLAALNWVMEYVSGDSVKDVNVNFYLDSELVVRQLTGVYKIKQDNLIHLAGQVKSLERKMGEVVYIHVPREKNKIADSLVNKAIDSSIRK